MQLINGRTAAQWRAYDRAHLAVAFLIALLLFFLWLAERGPWTAAACCGVPDARAGAAAAAVPAQPVSAPTAAAAAVAPAPAPTVDPACAEALPAKALFASNGTDLTADDRAALDQIARCLGDRHLEVGGHADSSGPAGTNERLGEERARTVADYLVSRGVERSRIEAHGYAATRPVADNSTPEGRASNRRAEVRAQ